MTVREVGVLPGSLRQDLVRTAAAEFARAGYEKASLNRVLRAVGMSKSSFYHYLGSKEALFEMVVADGTAALTSLVEVPPPAGFAGDFWGEAERLLERLAGLAEAPPWLADVGRLFYLDDAPLGEGSALGTAGAAIDRWLSEVIAVGRGAGVLREDLPESLQVQMVLAVLRTMDEWSLRHVEAASREDVVRAQLDAVRRLVSP